MLFNQNKGISQVVIMFIAAGVVIAGVSYWLLFTANMNGEETDNALPGEEAMMEDNSAMDEGVMQDDAMEEGDAMMHDDTIEQGEDTAPPANNNEDAGNQDRNDPPAEEPTAASGVYIDYSAQALATAQAEGKKPVLFFWAAWCPYCKAANEEFNANLGNIPANVVLLKTNYDTETQLKTKYGITYQHTFVQVDANGNQVTKWSGGGMDELIANVN
jgi:thiol-disulfide isomerase/thioredoxin